MHLRTFTAGLLLMMAAAAPARAQRFMAVGVSDRVVLDFFQKFQVAIVQNNHAAIAGMIAYPLHVNRGADSHHDIASRAELLKQYDAVFTPAIRQAIILEKAANLFGSADGVAIQRGLLWLRGTCDHAHPPKCMVGLGTVNLEKGK